MSNEFGATSFPRPSVQIGGLGIASYVLGIAAWLYLPLTGLICGVLAIVFAQLERGKINREETSSVGRNFAKAGLTLGIIDVSLSLICCSFYIIYIIALSTGAAK